MDAKEYLKQLLQDKNNYPQVNLVLEKEVYPDIEVLKQHIEDLKTIDAAFYREDMEVKLAALTYEPTPLEMTMTASQLYLAKSPLWALSLTPKDIFYVLDTPDDEVEDTFKELKK